MTGERGFTLLELLIGMTLLGFILALLFGGFRLASNSWDAVSQHTERTAADQLGRSFLRRVLPQVQAIRWTKAPNQAITFTGDANRLIAVAPISGQSGSGGLRVIELVIEPAGKDEGPLRLALREAPLLYDAEQFADALVQADSHVLLANLKSADFSYFGPPRKDDSPAWSNVWSNPEQIPQLVSLRAVGTEPGWTDLVVAPMLGESGCRWDAFYRRCR